MLYRFIFLLFPLIFWAQNYQDLLNEIVSLNIKNQNLSSTQEILKVSQKKERIYQEIISSITTQKPEDSSGLQSAIENLQLSLNASTLSPELLASNTLKLNGLLVQKAMQDLAFALILKIHFSQQKLKFKT